VVNYAVAMQTAWLNLLERRLWRASDAPDYTEAIATSRREKDEARTLPN
jgi:hypothetical protein